MVPKRDPAQFVQQLLCRVNIVFFDELRLLRKFAAHMSVLHHIRVCTLPQAPGAAVDVMVVGVQIGRVVDVQVGM